MLDGWLVCWMDGSVIRFLPYGRETLFGLPRLRNRVWPGAGWQRKENDIEAQETRTTLPCLHAYYTMDGPFQQTDIGGTREDFGGKYRDGTAAKRKNSPDPWSGPGPGREIARDMRRTGRFCFASRRQSSGIMPKWRNASMTIEYKGCTDEQTGFEYVKRNFNRVAGRHITLDNGKKAKDKFTQAERALEEENEEAAENGSALEYVWKDDLRERIRIAMEIANSEDDFLEALEDEGVTARYGNSKRYGRYISYELVDVPAHMESADRKYKARSYTLGDAYGVEALREKLLEKSEKLLRMVVGQQEDTAGSKGNPPGTSQSGLYTEAAAQAPVNSIPEMKHVSKPKDPQTVRDVINSVIVSPRRETRAETPVPVQPAAHTVPFTAAEASSTPEVKQPVQSATAPRMYEGYFARMQDKRRKADEKEAKKQAEEQSGGLEP